MLWFGLPQPLLGPGDLGYVVQMGNNSQHLGLGPEQDSCMALKPDSAKLPLRLAHPCSALTEVCQHTINFYTN